MSSAVIIEKLSHHFGKRCVLNEIDLACAQQTCLGILGPNGSGKTTLFKILSTLIRPRTGQVKIFDLDILQFPDAARRNIGVVFQSPSLDRKLSVKENLRHFGYLYGLSGRELSSRIDAILEQLHLNDRISDPVETLSGGLQRRVELARGLLHQPRLLILDEPTTGLDPAIRDEFWTVVNNIRESLKSTIIFTTHLFDEAERCDELAILDDGAVVAFGSPDSLTAEIRRDVVTIGTRYTQEIISVIDQKYGLNPRQEANGIRVETDNGGELVTNLIAEFDGRIDSFSSGKSGLKDVYYHKTGKQSKWNEG